MEWPYQSMRRHRMPPDERPLNVAEYNFANRPYGNDPKFAKYKKLTSHAGSAFTHNWVVNEKEHPTTGTPLRLGAGAYSAARRISGPRRAALWTHAVQGGESRRLRRRLADRLQRRRSPTTTRSTMLLGCSGTMEGIWTRCPTASSSGRPKLNCVEVSFKRAIGKMGRHFIPGRAGVTTEGVLNNKYRTKLHGARPLRTRLRPAGAFHSPHRADLSGARHGQHGTCARIRHGKYCSDESTNKARGVRVIDTNTKEVIGFHRARRRARRRAASTPRAS